MRWGNPTALLIGLALLPLVVGLLLLEFLAQRRLARAGVALKPRGGKVLAGALVAALLIGFAADPRRVVLRPIREETVHLCLVALLDTSPSMGAEDLDGAETFRNRTGKPPTRLNRALDELQRFLQETGGYELALRLFTADISGRGSYFLKVERAKDQPGDRATLLFLLRTTRPAPDWTGTDLLKPLQVARGMLKAQRTPGASQERRCRPAVLLFTDGGEDEHPADRRQAILELVRAMRQEGIATYAFGVGGPGPATIPVYIRNQLVGCVEEQGTCLTTRLDESFLREIGQEGGGGYVRFDRPGRLMEALRATIVKETAFGRTRMVPEERSLAWAFLLGAFLAGLFWGNLLGWLSAFRRRRLSL